MTTNSDEQPIIDEQAAARITPWVRSADLPPLHGRRFPRYQVSLAAPADAAALFKRVEADRRALKAQVDTDYQARVDAVQREYAAGDMTPRRRGELLAEASIERASRVARIDDAFAGLDEQAALKRARQAAADAQVATWREAIATFERTLDGPDAA